MPDIIDIPDANSLHAQLDLLNQAIQCLQGTPPGAVNYLTVQPPAAPPDNAPPDVTFTVQPPDIRVTLNPPITDVNTITTLIGALQTQANDVTQQLLNMGFTNTGTRTAQQEQGQQQSQPQQSQPQPWQQPPQQQQPLGRPA
jgi:hypothetical protein